MEYGKENQSHDWIDEKQAKMVEHMAPPAHVDNSSQQPFISVSRYTPITRNMDRCLMIISQPTGTVRTNTMNLLLPILCLFCDPSHISDVLVNREPVTESKVTPAVVIRCMVFTNNTQFGLDKWSSMTSSINQCEGLDGVDQLEGEIDELAEALCDYIWKEQDKSTQTETVENEPDPESEVLAKPVDEIHKP